MYRMGAMTAWFLRRLNLVKSKFFSQPNLLADRRIIGEY
jgi:lipid A disaccharide synthetase